MTIPMLIAPIEIAQRCRTRRARRNAERAFYERHGRRGPRAVCRLVEAIAWGTA